MFQSGLINTSFVVPFKYMQVYDTHTSNHIKFQSSNDLLKTSSCIFTNAQKGFEQRIFSQNQQVVLEKMRESMGATIQNNHIQAALIQYIKLRETSILLNSKVALNLDKVTKSQKFNFKQPFINLKVSNSKNESLDIKTRLVVASDGAKSSIRQQLNIPSTQYTYQQTGIVCTIELEQAIETAFQRFVQGANPLALLPLWNGTASIVWSNSFSRNQELLELSESQFIDELNAALQAPSHGTDMGLGNLLTSNFLGSNDFERPPIIKRLLSKRFSFPLQNSQNLQYTKKRVAFIGDAAHSIHPLAGQGMNLGITDAVLLANEIIQTIQLGEDIGKKQVLQNYQKQAKKNAQSMMVAINSVHQIYKRNDPLSSVVKGIGSALLHNSTFAKQNIMNFASGAFTHPLKYKWVQQD